MTREYIRDMINDLARTVDTARYNNDKGNDVTAALILVTGLKSAIEQVNEIIEDYTAATMTDNEKSARKAAFDYMKANMNPWDWNEEYEDNPLSIGITCSDLADQLEEYFGEDSPADIVNDLRAC